jgi:chromosome segregation ATPase
MTNQQASKPIEYEANGKRYVLFRRDVALDRYSGNLATAADLIAALQANEAVRADVLDGLGHREEVEQRVVASWRARAEAAEARVVELTEQLSASESAIDAYRDQRERFSTQAMEARQQVASLQAQLREREEECQRLRGQLEVTKRELKAVLGRIESDVNEVRSYLLNESEFEEHPIVQLSASVLRIRNQLAASAIQPPPGEGVMDERATALPGIVECCGAIWYRRVAHPNDSNSKCCRCGGRLAIGEEFFRGRFTQHAVHPRCLEAEIAKRRAQKEQA